MLELALEEGNTGEPFEPNWLRRWSVSQLRLTLSMASMASSSTRRSKQRGHSAAGGKQIAIAWGNGRRQVGRQPMGGRVRLVVRPWSTSGPCRVPGGTRGSTSLRYHVERLDERRRLGGKVDPSKRSLFDAPISATGRATAIRSLSLWSPTARRASAARRAIGGCPRCTPDAVRPVACFLGYNQLSSHEVFAGWTRAAGGTAGTVAFGAVVDDLVNGVVEFAQRPRRR